MSLTVKHLNADASFLLIFSPSPEDCQQSPFHSVPSQDFTVLLDPWLVGGSKIYHTKFSYSTHREPIPTTSLAELSEPDVVIISQSKTDHCNEATLRTLPASGTNTIILAEPSAAKVIRSWKYFDESKIVAMKPYTAPTRRPSSGGRRVYIKNKTLHRILIPALAPGGLHGQATFAYLPQKLDVTGLHNAMAITYRPPTASIRPSETRTFTHHPSPLANLPLTPPDSPMVGADRGSTSSNITPAVSPVLHQHNGFLSPPSPPRSQVQSPITPRLSASSNFSSASSTSLVTTATKDDTSRPETLSVIFSPHGVSPRALDTYIQHQLTPWTPANHLPPNPLTLLLHCFDAVSNPWFMGGSICFGYPSGKEIAMKLKAKAWVSAHDEDKVTTGVATLLTKFNHYGKEEVKQGITPTTPEFKEKLGTPMAEEVTDVVVLGVGEELTLNHHIVAVSLKKDNEDTTLGKVKYEGADKVKKQELDEEPLDNPFKHQDGVSNRLPKRGIKRKELAETTLVKTKDEDDEKIKRVKRVKKEELDEGAQLPARRKDPRFDEEARRLRDARINGVYVPIGAPVVDPLKAQEDKLAKDIAELEQRTAPKIWESPHNRLAKKKVDIREWYLSPLLYRIVHEGHDLVSDPIDLADWASIAEDLKNLLRPLEKEEFDGLQRQLLRVKYKWMGC